MKNYYKSRSLHPAEQISQRIHGAYHRFFAGFADSSGIKHALSKGEARETPVKEFFESLLPGKFGVASGEVVDSEKTVSAQSDVLIFRSEDGIPILKEEPTVLPVEAVMAVVEIKSKISVPEYKDCLKKAKKFYALKPFGKQFQTADRGRQPTAEECRVFVAVFAYSTDIAGDLAAEYHRYFQAAKEEGIDPKLIDRIYILGKGVINPSEARFANDTEERKVGLFYLYSNALQFLMREGKRRKEVPYLSYFGRMSHGWKRI